MSPTAAAQDIDHTVRRRPRPEPQHTPRRAALPPRCPRLTAARWLTALTLAGTVLGFGALPASATDGVDTKGLERASNPDWMAGLPDSRPLTDLSIPGTHDTMARDVTPIAETQQSDLPQQYKSGIRAVDIRLRHIGDRFTIHHGVVYLKKNFTDVLQQTTSFLKEHPQETVVMRIQKEHTEENVTRTFEQTLDWYLNANPETADLMRDHWWKPNSSADPFPTLGETRGKIVFLQNFDSRQPYGLRWSGANMDVEDHYEVPTIFDIPKRWNNAKAQLDKLTNPAAGKMYVTHFSGASAGAYPIAVAGGSLGIKGVNSRGFAYLESVNSPCTPQRCLRKTGTVMMDFPGPDLVNRILRYNSG
ncbi:phosphatidylinositol-specific phospholipase C [Streptomyces sp. H27-D2]|uniref:phosphatidylinositol-specific phospholipase C n=1 Tax=Streptomyces sp. H27-D2 TaxID=3046304 RepID=UPI002DBD89DD|nr:phosphatidylinositol-specific phospholipase C [Streptomyces sp. H27-D2]MEC4015474.1 phosphatidylinositol-specific phospholipase C [Streptomyces sp. H27-D2]